MKAVTASRHEAIIESQVVEAHFISMVVTGRPVIEILDDDDDVGLDVALGGAPGVTPGVEPGISLGVVLDAEPVAAPTPVPIVEPCVALGVAPVLYERMQWFNLYRAILPYLVMLGTFIAPGPGCSFDWSPFPCYLRYQFSWSVFLDWAFPFDKRRWHLMSDQCQRKLHAIFSGIFGCTGAGLDLLAVPDFPRWMYPITHEHWSGVNIKEQHVLGKILNIKHYWRYVILPGDAAKAAGLTRRIMMLI
jgi:hypothetical protein